MQEIELSKLTAAQFRAAEASFFLGKFVESSGPPRDSYFEMVCFFDAVLNAVVSVVELADPDRKRVLMSSSAFRFVKALRNVNTHHSVLAAALVDGKFTRPFIRHVSEELGEGQRSSARLEVHCNVLRDIFDSVERIFPREKENLNAARHALKELEAPGSPIFIDAVLAEVIERVLSVAA